MDDDRDATHLVEWNDENTQRLWDFYGESEAHRTSYFGETVGRHFVRVVKRTGLLKNTKKIVDISCGTGAIIENLLKVAPPDCEVEGYDPSVRSVQKTNTRNTGRRNFIGSRQVIQYPIPEIKQGSVDLLIMTEVVEHLDDKTLFSILGECHRILSPNGHLVITTPNDEYLAKSNVICPDCGGIFHRWQHQRSWTESSLSDTLKTHGFSSKIKRVTWGNELIDFATFALRRKKTGLFCVSQKIKNWGSK